MDESAKKLKLQKMQQIIDSLDSKICIQKRSDAFKKAVISTSENDVNKYLNSNNKENLENKFPVKPLIHPQTQKVEVSDSPKEKYVQTINKGIKRKNSFNNSPKRLKSFDSNIKRERRDRTINSFFSIVKSTASINERKKTENLPFRRKDDILSDKVNLKSRTLLHNFIDLNHTLIENKTETTRIQQMNLDTKDNVLNKGFSQLKTDTDEDASNNHKQIKIKLSSSLVEKECIKLPSAVVSISETSYITSKFDVLKKSYSTQNYGEHVPENKNDDNSMPITTKENKRAKNKIIFNQFLNTFFENIEKNKHEKTKQPISNVCNNEGQKTPNALKNIENFNQGQLTFSNILNNFKESANSNIMSDVKKQKGSITNINKKSHKHDVGIESQTNNSEQSKIINSQNFEVPNTSTLDHIKKLTFSKTVKNADNLRYLNIFPGLNKCEDHFLCNRGTKRFKADNEVQKKRNLHSLATTFTNKNIVQNFSANTQIQAVGETLVIQPEKNSDLEDNIKLQIKFDSQNIGRVEDNSINKTDKSNEHDEKIVKNDSINLSENFCEQSQLRFYKNSFEFNKTFKASHKPLKVDQLQNLKDMSEKSLDKDDKLFSHTDPIPEKTQKPHPGQKLIFQNVKISEINADFGKELETKVYLKNVLLEAPTTTGECETPSEIFECKNHSSENFPLSQYLGVSENTEIIKNRSLIKSCANDLLEDEMLFSILSKNYEKCQRLEKRQVTNLETSDTNSSKKRKSEMCTPEKCYIKRYRKDNTKIYRLEKTKKKTNKYSQIESTSTTKTVSFEDIFKNLKNCDMSNNLKKSQSFSSLSTNSSYVTDETKSEVLSTGSKELLPPKKRLRKGINEISKNKSLLYCATEYQSLPELNKTEIMGKIQEIFLRVYDDLRNGKQAVLTFRRQSMSNCVFKDGRLQSKPDDETAMTFIKSSSPRSHSKFKLILYIMQKIYNLLETNTKVTKRELYYQLKSIVSDQGFTNRAINAISCLLNVGVWKLNIIAQKGLIFGNLKILLTTGETINCNVPGTLIPQDVSEICEIHSRAYFILVVEKESIFQKLIDEDLPNKLTRPFILISGKGFPDLNTRLFLKKIWMIMSIPVFILVDADPHGIHIMLNYRFGSVNSAHVSQHLAVPKAKWLGVYPSEITNYNMSTVALSEHELRLAEHLLRAPYVEDNPRIAAELKIMVETKHKSSIEGLLKGDIFLSEVYLPHKFYKHDFI